MTYHTTDEGIDGPSAKTLLKVTEFARYNMIKLLYFETSQFVELTFSAVEIGTETLVSDASYSIFLYPTDIDDPKSINAYPFSEQTKLTPDQFIDDLLITTASFDN